MKVSGKIFLFVLIASGFFTQYSGATVYRSNGSVSNAQALHDYYARDGDTITLPPGRFSWTRRLKITKGITLQGETTITGAGTSNPVVADQTIIRDDTPRTGAIIDASIGSFRSFRLTGITFAPGSIATDGRTDAMHLVSDSSSTIRIDHCHFGQLHQIKIIGTLGDIRGVADHNYIEVIANHYPFNFRNDTYGGKTFGDGSFADYPFYGTDKFFFAEDNTIVRVNATAISTLADASLGARYVLRHNYVKNCMPANHGTESRGRGTRVHEVYGNVFEITIPWGGGGTRGGTLMWHDNNFIGVKPAGNQICHYANFRNFRLTKPYGLAIGDSPWDKNDTEGNGTYVEGHTPYLFASGTATASMPVGTMTDTTKNWTPDQWKGYSIKCSSGVAAQHGSYITSNTSNTITYYHDPGAIQDLVFNSGDSYQIRRCLQALDQCGTGKGDLISGSISTPINTRTGTAQWPRNAVEPCYTWNNVYTPDGTTLVSGGKPRENLSYFDLGAGFPSNTTPSAVSSRYTAALNGVDYTGPFVYPHPLTLLPVGTARAFVADFNGTGRPDYVLQTPNTRQTAIWYLNNNVVVGGAYGPTLPPGWDLVGVADFNRDGHRDYALFNSITRQTAIWYLSGPTFLGAAYGPALPTGWGLVATADFNGDSKPDYLLYNGSTRQTAIWYLNNNVVVGGAYGPTLPPGWNLVGVADFNRAGHPDYLLFNSITCQTAIWYLSGPTFLGAAYGPTLPLPPSGWALVAAADFNGDSQPDYLLYNVNIQQTAIWYLNNNVFVGGAYGPTLPAGWSFFGP